MMYNLIVPCAGESSRFPNMRPKWLLSHPNGGMMLVEGLKGLNLEMFHNIYIVVLEEHLEKYNCEGSIYQSIKEINNDIEIKVVILEEKTSSQPETVAKAIEIENIEGSIYIKDSDSYFIDDRNYGTNSICTYSLYDLDLTNPKNKSYITTDDHGFLTNIVEKKIISSDFCVGGYVFRDVGEYIKYYNKIKHYDNLYVSHIVYVMLLDGHKFKEIKVEDFKDWGTLNTWNMYKSEYRVLFIDLDGTLVKNSAEHTSPFWGTTDSIEENVKRLRELYSTGKVQIVITTSRKEKYDSITRKQLKHFGIPYDKIIYGILHSKRTIINDYAPTNVYPSCDSVNIPRNSNILGDLL